MGKMLRSLRSVARRCQTTKRSLATSLSEPVFVQSYPGSRVLTLSLPNEGNELTPTVTNTLSEKLKSYTSNASVSAVFFASRSPDVFSVSGKSSAKKNLQNLNNFILELASFKKPTLSVYSGQMNGTGYAAFAGSKYLLGGPSFSLVSNELSFGTIPSAGFAFHFTKCGKYGMSLARYIATSQCDVRGDDLYSLGMLTHLVEDEAHVSLADALAHTIPGKAAAEKGIVVVEDSLEDLLSAMHVGDDDVEDGGIGDPLQHEAWEKILLVPPNRQETKAEELYGEGNDEANIFSIRDDVLKCFNVGSPEMAIKKLSEVKEPWASDAIERLSTVDRKVLNAWWKVTEMISFPGVKIDDFLRQEAQEIEKLGPGLP